MSRTKKLRSPRLNEVLAAKIKGLWQDTSLNQAQIAAELGALNQERVSEVINGQRFSHVKPQTTVVEGRYE